MPEDDADEKELTSVLTVAVRSIVGLQDGIGLYLRDQTDLHDGVERLLEDEIEIMITVLSREPTYIFRKRHFPSRLPAPLILDPD